MKYFLFLILTAISGVTVFAQDCGNPITLCSNVPETIDSTSFAGGFGGPCFTATQSIYYTFTTNDPSGNPSGFSPYEVGANIQIENCTETDSLIEVIAGFYEVAPGQSPCNPMTSLNPCDTSTTSFQIGSGTLLPNTTYYMVLGINPLTAGFSCNVEVTLSGSPIEIDACCDDSILAGSSSDLVVFGAVDVPNQPEYFWSPEQFVDDFEIENPIATPAETTTFSVQAQIGDCQVTDEVTITVSTVEIIIPNDAITPDGNNLNDTWFIRNINLFENPIITVYDRWGQEVFNSIGYDKEWDGTNEGRRLATGTYYYVIEVNSATNPEQLTGHVAILN